MFLIMLMTCIHSFLVVHSHFLGLQLKLILMIFLLINNTQNIHRSTNSDEIVAVMSDLASSYQMYLNVFSRGT